MSGRGEGDSKRGRGGGGRGGGGRGGRGGGGRGRGRGGDQYEDRLESAQGHEEAPSSVTAPTTKAAAPPPTKAAAPATKAAAPPTKAAAPATKAAAPAQAVVPFVPDYNLVARDKIRPVRPSVGQAGKKIRLFANFYKIQIPSADFYHYDVDIQPESVPAINRKIIDLWKAIDKTKEAQISVYDGRKNLYTPRKLPTAASGIEVKVTLPDEDGRGREPQVFTVKIKQVNVLSMERLQRYLENKGEEEVPRESLQVLDVLLKARPTALFDSVTNKVGGAFYGAYDPKFNISSGLNARNGWRQSIRPTWKDVLLNIDISTTTYYQHGPLLQVVASFFNKPRILDVPPRCFAPNSIEFQRLSKFLATVTIDITHRDTGRRKYKIRRLHKMPCSKATLKLEGPNAGDMAGKTITVQQYFLQFVNKKLQYPDLPPVECGTNGILIPMEFCVIRPGQRHIGKLNEVQTADIIKIAAVAPPERNSRIETGRRTLHSGQETDQLYKEWGISLSPKMTEVEGRILPAPVLTASQNSTVRPQNGAVDFSKIREGFYRPATLGAWAVCVFGNPARMPFDAVVEFMEKLFQGCASKGMNVIPRNWRQVIIAQQGRTIEDTLVEANQRAVTEAENRVPAAQLIFCIFEKGGGVYDEIKLLSETKLGFVTQCFLAKHLFNTKPGVTINLALKVNAKIGGVNCIVEPAKQLNILGQNVPTMIMGADVTHPPAGAGDGQGVSIAAVVASMDSKFAEYRAAIRVQPPRLEIIGSLGNAATELLQQFQKRAGGRYPGRLVFYRDGVSEGQFGEVALQEVTALKRTLRELGADTKLTFLVVNKRHAARFFCQNSADADRKGNLMAGTVVDSGVTHPYEFDFYLNSHTGLQGTSRASHYHVLYDENQFTPDNLQEITYRMCYLYARATRAVSIVPPAYYAHLVAARARCHRAGGITGSSEVSGGSGIESATAEQFMPVTAAVRERMYFT